MAKITKFISSTLSSGGVLNYGSKSNYVTDLIRRGLNIGLAQYQDGEVSYFSKDFDILKRAVVQRTHQMAYGLLRSYPRYIRYWEQQERDKYLQTQSQTSIANKGGQYYQLIKEQKPVEGEKTYADTIVGNKVWDYLELSIEPNGSYYNNKTHTVEPNTTYGLTTFVDLQPQVSVNSKNNVVMTIVQGRDYSRKEYVSGGDLEISINGKITSKYPNVYPEAEVSKFLNLMQYKGVLNCKNTILKQFKINQLIILNYNFPATSVRNVQPYSINCVAIEPTESISIITREEEKLDESLAQINKWVKLVKLGTQVVDPSSLLKISRLWI